MHIFSCLNSLSSVYDVCVRNISKSDNNIKRNSCRSRQALASRETSSRALQERQKFDAVLAADRARFDAEHETARWKRHATENPCMREAAVRLYRYSRKFPNREIYELQHLRLGHCRVIAENHLIFM